jgi:hypothetical protein
VSRGFLPREMLEAPWLDPARPATPVAPHRALADARAHQRGAATPAHRQVEYWDENLPQGRPPFSPMPQVVGISVHQTFARRAYESASVPTSPTRWGDR